MAVTQIFANLPVRRKDFESKYKKYAAKMKLYAQSIILLHRNVKVNLFNVKDSGEKEIIISSIKDSDLISSITNLFHVKSVIFPFILIKEKYSQKISKLGLFLTRYIT